ncbi:MAG TPA: phage protein Gp36 family protein [Pyrinomonadaceae bacterium]|nr:phage protein Gp36 family protein [Pyrinomonadaceae bacterium]
MSYITQSDLEDAVGGIGTLVQLTSETDEVDVDVVNKIIAWTEGVFEAHVRQRYELPVRTTEMVRSICVDLAVFKLRGLRAVTVEGVYAVAKTNYDNAIKLLQKISERKASLDIPAAEETKTNPVSADRVLKGPSRPSPFSDDKLSGF